jgi:hypothetical protein
MLLGEKVRAGLLTQPALLSLQMWPHGQVKGSYVSVLSQVAMA